MNFVRLEREERRGVNAMVAVELRGGGGLRYTADQNVPNFLNDP